MRVCSIASGSSGNCIYVGTDSTHLLVDAGISGKKIEQGLNKIGLTGGDIDALLITHEHADHIKSLGVLARKLGMPIVTAKKTYEAATQDSKTGKMPEGLLREIKADREFVIGNIKIRPFSTSHDAAEPFGYRFDADGKSFAVATDLGCYDDYIVDQLKNLDTLLLESNHDVNMLEVGAYPYYLKKRILSDRGHLSNESAGKLLNAVLHDNMKSIILGHLSRENNYPALAYETVCSEITFGEGPYKAGDFNIEVAKREEPGELLEW